MAYRVEIVQDKCASSGRCVANYPAAFAFDDEELATVLPTVGNLTDRHLLRAARNCPSQAIQVYDENGNLLQ